MKILIIILLMAVLTTVHAKEHDSLLAAIRTVESSNRKVAKDGDNGKSIGHYQIGKLYFKDAAQQNPDLGIYKYSDVRKEHVAVAVIRAYWAKYATREHLGHEPTDKDRARLHNGGPDGCKKQSTLKYWKKIQKAMK